MKNKTLLIMAAGMGSRFGGLKQIEPVGPNGEIILEYSIYDALKYGFNKVVFVIKEENYDLFKNVVGEKIENICEVKYVFQTNDLDFIDIPKSRIKPLGTAHAIYSCKDVINESFAIINADDFYGEDAFKVLSKSLDDIDDNEFSLISYDVKNTITEKGSVKRGICEVENNNLVKITECEIRKENDSYFARELDSDEESEINANTIVSMNMFGFNIKLFDYIENDIKEFFINNKNNIDTVEYLIPSVVDDMINKDIINVKVVNTTAKWLGMTYKEDLPLVRDEIAIKHKNKEYPNKLF